MLPCNQTHSKLVKRLDVQTVGTRQPTQARKNCVLAIGKSFGETINPEHQVYHDWLQEYGEDL